MPEISPVDHDPFADPTLVPIDHDPFQDNPLAQYNATARAIGSEVVKPAVEAYQHASNLVQGHGDFGTELASGLIAAGGVAAPQLREAGIAGELATNAASRIARAQALGFRTGMPLSFGTAPADERIAAAALNLDGKVFTGSSHLDAMMRAEEETGKPLEKMEQAPIFDGFLTNAGRFVSRWEAGDIAARAGQGETGGIFGATRGLASEDISAAGRKARSSVRTGATAPGLPGGQGVWGVLEQAPARMPDGSVALWHRADRLAVLDAEGTSDAEIQATLKDAWDRGHDAVMLRNYTRPGGKTPENVVVVRHPNQLRQSNAAFDPAKKLSPNLLAGIAGGIVLPSAAGVLAPVDHDPFAGGS